MKITFNNHKGFLLDEENMEINLDIRDYLTKLASKSECITLPKSKSKVKSKSKSKGKSKTEYRTDGFDSLSNAWNTTPQYFDVEPSDESINDQKIGEYLRKLSYNSINSSSDDDLSSHTTIYGEDVLPNIISNSADDQDIITDKSKTKKVKLSPDERKDLRKKARESKKNAKLEKKQKKNLGNLALNCTSDANLNSSKSKINHLKVLLKECYETAQSKCNDKLSDMSRVFQIDDVSVYISDLANLLDDEWLSDSNIGFIYKFLYQGYILPLLSVKLKNSKFYQFDNDQDKEIFVSPTCLLLPTFTFLIANHPNPIDLVTSKVLPLNISESQIIFCPLNDNDDFGSSEGGSHWSLVVFLKLLSTDHSNNKEYTQKALVFDSMFEANCKETNQLVSNMSKILYNEKDPKSSLKWDIIHVRDSPQQTNGSDCGVYVSSVTSCLVSQLIMLSKSDDNSCVDFSLENLRFSAVDSRIWMLSTLLNCLKNSK